MKSLYSVDHKSFNNLKDSVELPKYQRRLVWSKDQKRDFIQNISQGYPFGSILIYKYDNSSTGKYTLIDGQQRFSTLIDYQENPHSYYTDYEKFRNEIIAYAEEELNSELSNDSRQKLSDEVDSILKDYIKEHSHEARYIRDRVNKEISFFPGKPKDLDYLIDLRERLNNDMNSFIDIDKVDIPCIVFEGPEENLPDVFANINQGGSKLTKFQVFAALWSRDKVQIDEDDDNVGDQLLDTTIGRYKDLNDSRSLQIEDFDPDKYKECREMNLSEYCYSVGYLVLKKCQVFFSTYAKKPTSEKEDKCNIFGFYTIAIALGIDIKSIKNLSNKKHLFEESKTFATELAYKCIDEWNELNNIFKEWLKIPGTDERYENGALTDMQLLSYFASVWHRKYTVDENNKTIKIIPKYKHQGYTAVCNNIIGYSISDIIANRWGGSGDTRLSNYYIKREDASQLSYESTLSRENLQNELLNWNNSECNSPSINISKESKYILCMQSNVHRCKYSAQKYDLEHIIPKKWLKDSEYEVGSVAGGALGSIAYLNQTNNRSKKAQTLYDDTAVDETKLLNQEYLDSIFYPKENEINDIRCDLKNKKYDSSKNKIKERGDQIIKDLCDNLPNLK